jgi:hypothetical protein
MPIASSPYGRLRAISGHPDKRDLMTAFVETTRPRRSLPVMSACRPKAAEDSPGCAVAGFSVPAPGGIGG